jgi:hypothetical protein
MLMVMVVLFLALVGVLVKNYATSWARREDEQAPTTRRAAPSSLPAIREGLPAGAGFTQRNLDFGGNLAPILKRNGEELEMDESVFRVATDVLRVDPEKFSQRTSQMPAVKDLLADAESFSGLAFTFRCVPAEVLEYVNIVPERVNSWRIYALMQRSPEEFVVLETLATPPFKEWTLKRDVVELDALYMRNASYKNEKGKTVHVPYFLAKSYRRVIADASAGPNPSLFDLLTSKYGPFIAGGILVFVSLTVWTLRRHGRQVERQEREHFYALLRARTKKKAAEEAAGKAGSPPQA